MSEVGEESLDRIEGLDRHVVEPLERAGYTHLSQIKSMSVEELASIVTGPRSREKLFAVLGLTDEYLRMIGKYRIEIEGLGSVSGGEVAQCLGLRGTARYFLGGDAEVQDLKLAMRDGRITEEQVARYILENRRARRELVGNGRVKAEEEGVKPAEQREAPRRDLSSKIDELVARYASEYDTRSWNLTDWALVRRLAMLEIYVEQSQNELLSRGPEALFQYAPQVKSLSDQINSGLAQIRQLRDELEISLKARAARDIHAEAYEVLTDFAARAKRVVADRSSILIHCGVRLGVCLPYFPRDVLDASVRVRCPICGEELIWNLVTPQMLEIYTEAGDFVPSAVPAGAFDRPEDEVQGERGLNVVIRQKDFKGIAMNRIS